MTGKLLPKDKVVAVDLFLKIPSLPTAKYLSKVWTESLVLFSFGFEERYTDKEFIEWRQTILRNLDLIDKIQKFLFKSAAEEKLKIGFHKLRDQQILFQRLKVIARTKFLFEDNRQFLRNSITKNLDSYQVTADLICIHGINNGTEIFFNGLGQKADGQIYFESEVLFNISLVTKEFIELVKQFNR